MKNKALTFFCSLFFSNFAGHKQVLLRSCLKVTKSLWQQQGYTMWQRSLQSRKQYTCCATVHK